MVTWLESTVKACWVRAASHKPGARVKGKLISRRSTGEAEFLDNLVQLGDQIFTRYPGNAGGVKTRKELTGRMVRDQLKLTAAMENPNPNHFSSHSLRKGATTPGVSHADIRNRGNYVADSEVPRLTYDY